MNSSRKITSRSRKSSSPNSAPDVSQVPRGTPPGALAARAGNASNLKDRLDRITGCADARYLMRLAEHSRTYRDLIRRYSNDSML